MPLPHLTVPWPPRQTAQSRPHLQPVWKAHCLAAWRSRVYTPAAGAAGLLWRQRWLAHKADERRTTITKEELCTFCWRFRFKPQAGEWWIDLGESTVCRCC